MLELRKRSQNQKLLTPLVVRLAMTILMLLSWSTWVSAGNVDPQFITRHDFSELLTPKTAFLGFIGPNFRRLNIAFNSVSKSASDPKQYLIKGRSTVGKNHCAFAGSLVIENISDLPIHEEGDDNRDQGIRRKGVLTARYELQEEHREVSCGLFKGEMTLNWYLDREDYIRYNDLEEDESDNFNNNQYRGVWTAYGRAGSKTANWGEYRIPDSGDLDIGAGEFSPNPKYFDQGWANFGAKN